MLHLGGGSTRPSGDSRPAHHERVASRAAGSSGCGSGRGGRVRREGWLLLGPGRGRRDSEGTEGWVLYPGVVRHGPFGRLRAGFRKTPGRLTTNG